jgi:hypothetical protein
MFMIDDLGDLQDDYLNVHRYMYTSTLMRSDSMLGRSLDERMYKTYFVSIACCLLSRNRLGRVRGGEYRNSLGTIVAESAKSGAAVSESAPRSSLTIHLISSLRATMFSESCGRSILYDVMG